MANTQLDAALGPIGVFDSGVGGLSILAAALARLPQANFIYAADQGFAPYGNRSANYVRARALAITTALYERGCRVIVVACNTATAVAIDALRVHFPDCRFVGTEPGIKPAARQRGRVAVLATPQTLRSERFASLLHRFGKQARFRLVACPGWATHVERGDLRGAATRAAVRRRLAPLRAQRVRALVLGCTHYSFLTPLLTAAAGRTTRLIDTAPAIATRIAVLVGAQGPMSSSPPLRCGPRHVQLVTTGCVATLARQAARLLPRTRVTVSAIAA